MCVCSLQQSYDILLLILMVLLLVQAVLTSATVVHCASYKSQLRMGRPESEDATHTSKHCDVRREKNQVDATRRTLFFSAALLVFSCRDESTCETICLTLSPVPCQRCVTVTVKRRPRMKRHTPRQSNTMHLIVFVLLAT